MALTRINNQALPTGSIIQVATDKTTTNTTVTGTAYTASDVLTGYYYTKEIKQYNIIDVAW